MSSPEAPVKLTEDQISKCQAAFDKFDRRALDKIRIGDIANAFKEMSVSVKPEWLERVRDTIDEEGTGYITMEEFTDLYKRKLKADADEKELEEAFRVLDRENKGVIPVEDLKWILQSLGDDLTEDEIDEMIRDTDQDDSGTVDFDDAREAFDKFDRRGQDRIPIREIANAFKAFGVQIKHGWLDTVRESIDPESSGYISLDDFLLLYSRKLQVDADERELRDAFRALDKKNTGQIETGVLRWILKSLGDDLSDDEIEEMINETDTDGSGKVDFEGILQLILY